MALIINEEQQMLRESAQGFFAEFAPMSELRRLREDDSDYCDLLWKRMVDMGWAAILVPEKYGGLGFGHVGMGQIMEQSGRALAASPLFSSAVIGVSAINLLGDERQKETLLPQIAAGQLMLSLAIDESRHHEPNDIALSALKTPEGYRLSGKKYGVIDGHSSAELIVAARTQAEVGDKEGISLFLVDAKSSGLEILRTPTVDSRSVSIINFNEVIVPLENLLGPEGSGFAGLSSVLDIANAHLAAELLGIATESFDRTLRYLKERKQFGSLIGSFQALQHRTAHWWSEIELCKSIVLKCLSAIDEGDSRVPGLASIAKAKLCEVAELSTNEAIQMHGGVGMTDEYDIGFFIKRARPAQMLYGDYSYHGDRFAMMTGY